MGKSREFWQAFEPAAAAETPVTPVRWHDSFLATMPDGSRLLLPLRDFGMFAVAGLIFNQASILVADRLAEWLAAQIRPFAPDVVVGLPTLGHTVALGVARALGHPNWVPAGFSRKVWYDEALSVPVASITSPETGRRLWLDPRLMPRLVGRRVLLVDDVVSTGASLRAALALLAKAGVDPVAVGVAMIQGNRWQSDWTGHPLVGAFATPLFEPDGDGWQALPDTAPHRLCLELPR